jgi:Mg2+ and Co2+ transporter CorA
MEAHPPLPSALRHAWPSPPRVLTLTSVILLPGALIAGVMGMNFRVGLFQSTWVFYVALAMILGIAVTTLAVAKLRDWI